MTTIRRTFRISGVEARQLWEEVKANAAALDACKGHRFKDEDVAPGEKHHCRACGGKMSIGDVMNYIRGYQAAGGDANDVWPGWEKRHAQS